MDIQWKVTDGLGCWHVGVHGWRDHLSPVGRVVLEELSYLKVLC